MRDEPSEGVDLRTASTEEITAAMQKGVQAALRDHKQSGRAVVVWDWENDRVATVAPDQIEVTDETAPQTSGPVDIEPIAHPTTFDPPAPAPHHP